MPTDARADSVVPASGVLMSEIPSRTYAPRRCAGMTMASYSGRMWKKLVHRNARENPMSLGIKPTVLVNFGTLIDASLFTTNAQDAA
jgi:hypothetical protein